MVEVFFVWAITIAFFAYREFKGMLYEHMGVHRHNYPLVNE